MKNLLIWVSCKFKLGDQPCLKQSVIESIRKKNVEWSNKAKICYLYVYVYVYLKDSIKQFQG